MKKERINVKELVLCPIMKQHLCCNQHMVLLLIPTVLSLFPIYHQMPSHIFHFRTKYKLILNLNVNEHIILKWTKIILIVEFSTEEVILGVRVERLRKIF